LLALETTLIATFAILLSVPLADGSAVLQPSPRLVGLLIVVQSALHIATWVGVAGQPLFSPYVLLQVAIVAFHATYPLLSGDAGYGVLFRDVDDRSLASALLLVLLGAGVLHWAVLLGFAAKARREAPRQLDGRFRRSSVIAASVVAALCGARLIELLAMPVNYGELYRRTPTYLDFLLANFSFAAIAMVIVRATRTATWKLMTVLIAYGGLLILVGWRGHGFLIIVLGMWLLSRTRDLHLTMPAILALVVCLFFVFPLIGEIRANPGLERFSELRGAAPSWSDSVLEMGASIRTVAYTLQLVPSERPFDLGASYSWAATRVLPKAFFDVHPAATQERSPAQWLVWRVSPWTAQHGGAIGYSMFAEPYFNFGWFGPFIVLLPAGYFLGRLLLWSESTSNRAMAAYLVAVVFSVLIFGVRADSTVLFRIPIWVGVVPYLIVSSRLRLRRRAAAGSIAGRFDPRRNHKRDLERGVWHRRIATWPASAPNPSSVTR
jgi:hypothetical protein